MDKESLDYVWVFLGAGAKMPSAVFLEKSMADSWISENLLSGLLTRYPINVGLYDWAMHMRYFTPKRDDQRSPSFIGKFTCAYLKHYHYENGQSVTG